MIMLDRPPFTRTSQHHVDNAPAYHSWIQKVSEEELSIFVDTLAEMVSNPDTSLVDLVDTVEEFTECKLPFDYNEIVAVTTANSNIKTYVQFGMCGLRAVTGKMDGGGKMGVDCSLMGRCLNRIEQYFFAGIYELLIHKFFSSSEL